MWFKQIQLYKLTQPIAFSPSRLADRLLPLTFTPCLPSMPQSIGWISPIAAEEAPLVRGINGCMMICLQVEEKILPASVIKQTLKEKIKKIEAEEGRKLRQKDKLSFKDEVVHTLLPRAFTKLTQVYGYIDTRHHWLIVNTNSPAKAELFLSLFKKSVTEGVTAFDTIKPSSILTQWLKDKNYPTEFSIEKSCVLQDPNEQTRMIRCQQQDLFASSIQTLVKEGCHVIQVGLCWQDRINFILAEDFSLRRLHLTNADTSEMHDVMETKEQKFDADFVLMGESFAGLIANLLEIFTKRQDKTLAA